MTPGMASLARAIEDRRLDDAKNGQQGRNKSFPAFVQHLHDNPGVAATLPGFDGKAFEAIWRRARTSVAVHPRQQS